MRHIPPSAIALYSIFLFSGANAIIGYLINVKDMSVLYIMTIEHASQKRITSRDETYEVGHTLIPSVRLRRSHSPTWWLAGSAGDSIGNLGYCYTIDLR
jgi:hypothetical protein